MGRERTDIRDAPMYSVTEAAEFVHIPPSTLRSWVSPASGRPLIEAADPETPALSFYNLLEAHIVNATRKVHGVKLTAIRDALGYAARTASDPHPLLTRGFMTEGVYLFDQRLGELLNSSLQGQRVFADLLLPCLDRIDRDARTGTPVAWFPEIPSRPESRNVTIRPGVSSGAPTVTGTGIRISTLYGRRRAGDSIEDLALDYRIDREKVRDAIEYQRAWEARAA